jgi:DNA-binding NtrC family response regulator
VLAATNRDPGTSLRDGKLRQDLYYRLNVFTLELPPLRERIDDIPALVEHFVNEFAKANKKSVQGADQKALEVLADFHWPGNVRELRNVIERAVIICPRPLIGVEDLPPSIVSPSRPSVSSESPGDVSIPVGTTVERAERDLILKTLESTGHNKTKAAEILGISLKTLHNKLKKYKEQTED